MTEMKPYIVREGDDVAKVATSLGCDEDDIWKHEKNKGLQEEGRTKEALVPGDVLYVPDNPREPSPVQVENQNRFEAKQVVAQESKDDFDIHGCRLVVRLNKGASTQSTADAITADVVTSLLERIDKRLRTTLTSLDEVWSGANGGDASDNDEVWARLISELLVGTSYDSPGPAYGTGESDRWFHERFDVDGGCYPLVLACQQLTSIGVMSRGFSLKDIGGQGFNASGNRGNKFWKAWSTDNRYRTDIAWARGAPEPLAPGTAYEFLGVQPETKADPEKPDQKKPELKYNTDGAHIAFVLRVRGSPDRVQFLDTGGLNIANRNDRVTLSAGGNVDDPWANYVGGPPKGTFQGVGVPRPSPDLGAAVARLRRKFPLGFTRLVIRSRADDTVLYASPLVRMHGSGAEDNWSIARYVWSLRDLPNAEKVSAEWSFYIPRGALVDSAARATRRAYNLRQLRLCAKFNPRPRSDLASVLANEIWYLSKAVAQTDGSVRLISTKSARSSIGDKLPWDQRSGSLLSGIATAPSSVWGGNDLWASEEGSWVCVTLSTRGAFTEFKMDLTRAGDRWTGTYKDVTSGATFGTLSDGEEVTAMGTKIIVGRWRQSDGTSTGTFNFTFSSDLCSLSGGWTQDDDPKGGGAWLGER